MSWSMTLGIVLFIGVIGLLSSGACGIRSHFLAIQLGQIASRPSAFA